MGNKNIEIRCLERVIECSKSQHGESKRILDLLKGEDIKRDFDERPDFIKISKYNGNDVIVGVEHFQVDGFSQKKKNGKYAGSTIKNENDLHRIFEKYHNDITNNPSHKILDAAIEDIAKHICESLSYSELKTYTQFISNFNEKLSNHLKSADVYIDSINKLNKKCLPKKMVLLIDVRNDFSSMFINTRKNIRKLKHNEVPLFLDIVNLLDTIDVSKFDYVVLSLGGDERNQPNIIALPTGNIRQHLLKRNIKIYYYFGFDRFLPEELSKWKNLNISSPIEKGTKDFNIDFTFSGNELSLSAKMSLMFCGYYLSYNAKKIKENFVNDATVQMLLDVYSEYLIKWNFIDHDDVHLVEPIFYIVDNELLNQNVEKFQIKWDLIQKNEDKNE